MRKNSILLVDNDDEVFNVLVDSLGMDYVCEKVSDGEKGYSYLEAHAGEIDLIIIDLQTPEIKGKEILECMESNLAYKNIPVLVLASSEQTEEVEYAISMGADDVLLKPINPCVVKRRVDNVLCVGNTRMVHNVMEDLIREEMEQCIDNLGMCTCLICRRDLLTLTLNNEPPKYVTSEKGSAIAMAAQRTSRGDRIKLLTDITYYAQMVKERPSHK
ncbi:MAG: response regulator [Lachnospiraceae bacterium]|nr:response regulator [Lachnospiraceae bacterium]